MTNQIFEAISVTHIHTLTVYQTCPIISNNLWFIYTDGVKTR